MRSLSEVLEVTSGIGVTATDIDDLLAKGFLIAAGSGKSPTSTVPAGAPAAAKSAAEEPTDAQGEPSAPTPTAAERYRLAWPIATRITAKLGLRGFRLNLAVEAAAGYDDLVALVPRIAEATGDQAAAELRRDLGIR